MCHNDPPNRFKPTRGGWKDDVACDAADISDEVALGEQADRLDLIGTNRGSTLEGRPLGSDRFSGRIETALRDD